MSVFPRKPICERRPGYMDYADLATQSTPVQLDIGVWTDIPNDGLGPTTDKNFKPSGVDELLDESTGRIFFQDLRLGDLVYIRPDFFVTPDSNNKTLEFRFSIGQSGQEYFLRKLFPKLDSSNTTYQFSLDTFLVYIGNENTRIGGAMMQVRMLGGAGEMTSTGVAISVVPGR